MITLIALRGRLLAALGRYSMYRLVLGSLGLLALLTLGLSLLGLVAPRPLDLLAAAAVLTVVSAAVDALAHALLRRRWRPESSLITAGILLFVVGPTTAPAGLAGIALAAAGASASKYLLAWRGRHLLNPAAVGAAVLGIVAAAGVLPAAGSWWVGTPVLAGPVMLLGAAVAVRAERVLSVSLFVVVATIAGTAATMIQYAQAGLAVDAAAALGSALLASPVLFLGAFMLTEPLTQPPRRWQRLTVAGVVGVLAGWPVTVAGVGLGAERALLLGNVLAFGFAVRAAVRLTLVERVAESPTVRSLLFRASRAFAFLPGQYLELDVPHRRADARGTRREFSIVSAPEDLPLVRIAFRETTAGTRSSYKRALAQVHPGSALAITGVWGDFVLPADHAAPVLLVAAGIGVTPFVSQLRHARLAGRARDVVVAYVAAAASELAFRSELEASGAGVLVFTPDDPAPLAAGWTWMQGARLDAAALQRAVPDLAARHAFVSGPPGLIADLAPALARAHAVTTDAFPGY